MIGEILFFHLWGVAWLAIALAGECLWNTSSLLAEDELPDALCSPESDWHHELSLQFHFPECQGLSLFLPAFTLQSLKHHSEHESDLAHCKCLLHYIDNELFYTKKGIDWISLTSYENLIYSTVTCFIHPYTDANYKKCPNQN